jgi:hypothetical protein
MIRCVPPSDPGVRPDIGPFARINPKETDMTLTAKKVERTQKPGRYRCGIVKGLLLQISPSGAKSWVLRYDQALFSFALP